MDYTKLPHIKVTINDKEYDLMVAKSEEEKEYGLKGVSDLEESGMFFDYRLEPQEELSYWMSECSIPLDIIFVSDDMEVLQVFKGEPESEELLTCTAPEDSKIVSVIEIDQNSGVKEGDEVAVENEDLSFPPNKMFILNSDGSIQFELVSGERIFSRIFSRKLIRLCKRAQVENDEKAYKRVGKAIFKELSAQDNREPEYTSK